MEKQVNMLVDEYNLMVFESDVKEALENAGASTSKENIEKIIKAGMLNQLGKNTMRFIKEELEGLILNDIDTLGLAED